MKSKSIQEKYEERKKWFSDRVGKIIFRSKTTCPCAVCESVYQNGLLIESKIHGDYAMSCEGESWADGETGFKYFDTKEEVSEFEKNIKKG